ncbi:MAG: ABC transporter permease [Solirubrobacteraceae bacterium]
MRGLRGWRAALLLTLLLGAWEAYVDAGGADALILPAPHAVLSALVADRGLLWSNFLATAREVLLGVAFAAVVGLTVTVAMHFSRTLRDAIYPLAVASQAVPIILIAPVLLLWLGLGLLPKLVVIGLVSFFPVVVATTAGLAGVDPDLIKLMQTFDASRLSIFRHVELPSALPGLVTGAKIAVSVAVIGAVLGDTATGTNSGLPYLFMQSEEQLLMPRAYATVVLLCLFSLVLFGLLSLAERRALPWAYQSKGEINR